MVPILVMGAAVAGLRGLCRAVESVKNATKLKRQKKLSPVIIARGNDQSIILLSDVQIQELMNSPLVKEGLSFYEMAMMGRKIVGDA